MAVLGLSLVDDLMKFVDVELLEYLHELVL